jgi:hypothetical protein
MIGFAGAFGDPCGDTFDQAIKGIEEREQMGASPEVYHPWNDYVTSGGFDMDLCKETYSGQSCRRWKKAWNDARFGTKHFAYETSVTKLQKDRDELQKRLEFCRRQASAHINRSPFSLFVAPTAGEAVAIERSSLPYTWLLAGGGALFLVYALAKKKRTKT